MIEVERAPCCLENVLTHPLLFAVAVNLDNQRQFYRLARYPVEKFGNEIATAPIRERGSGRLVPGNFWPAPENFRLSARFGVRELNGPTSPPQKFLPPAYYSATPIRTPRSKGPSHSPHSPAFNAAAALAKKIRHLNACSTKDQIFLGCTGNVWQSENF